MKTLISMLERFHLVMLLICSLYPYPASGDWLRDVLQISQGTKTQGSPLTLAHTTGARVWWVCLSRATRVLRGPLEDALLSHELSEGTEAQEERISPDSPATSSSMHTVPEMCEI